MDGKEIKRRIQLLLDEEYDSDFLDEKTVYDFANEAALICTRYTNAVTSSQAITTVADQSDYTLNADFLKLYLRGKNGEYFIRYNDGSSTTFLPMSRYADKVYNNSSSSVTIPSEFSITDDRTLDSRITGTASATDALDTSSRESTLTDTGSPFSDVSAGDIVHNTTDASSGIVLEKTDDNNLVTALFPDNPTASVGQDWTSGDAYVIQPQGRYKIVLDPAPSTAGHTVTVDYVAKPEPVYANFRSFRFPQQLNLAVVKYAAWLFKYKDREPDFGDRWYVAADNEMRRGKRGIDNAINRNSIPVRMMARR